MSEADPKPIRRRFRWHAGKIVFLVVIALGAVAWFLDVSLSAPNGRPPAWLGIGPDEKFEGNHPIHLVFLLSIAGELAALASLPVIAIVQFARKDKTAGAQTLILLLAAGVYVFITMMMSDDIVH